MTKATLFITGLLFIGFTSCKSAKDGGSSSSSNAISKASIQYDLAFSSDDPAVQAQLGMMQGSEMSLTFSGNKMRTEMKMGSIMTNTTIIDGEAEKGLMTMSGMMGSKAVPMTKEDLKNEDADAKVDLDIEETDETKEIMGYTCKKVVITTEEGDAMIMWVTDKIKPQRVDGRFLREGVNGFPLLMELNQQGMQMSFKAKAIETNFKDKEMFDTTVPEGYEITTMDAIQGGM